MYYFAYGSNVLQERLEQRVGPVTFISLIRIAGYRLTFDAGACVNSVFANVKKTGYERDVVEGVIYQMTPEQEKILDLSEGWPNLYSKVIYPLYFPEKDMEHMMFYQVVGEPHLHTGPLARYQRMTPIYCQILQLGYERFGLVNNQARLQQHLVDYPLRPLKKRLKKTKKSPNL